MISNLPDVVERVIILLTIPGALGGLLWIMYELRTEKITNNKVLRKLLLDVCGGGITASVLLVSLVADSNEINYKMMTTACLIGLAWSSVPMLIREKATTFAKAALKSDDFKGNNEFRDQD